MRGDKEERCCGKPDQVRSAPEGESPPAAPVEPLLLAQAALEGAAVESGFVLVVVMFAGA
jgi:hypothetical protein